MPETIGAGGGSLFPNPFQTQRKGTYDPVTGAWRADTSTIPPLSTQPDQGWNENPLPEQWQPTGVTPLEERLSPFEQQMRAQRLMPQSASAGSAELSPAEHAARNQANFDAQNARQQASSARDILTSRASSMSMPGGGGAPAAVAAPPSLSGLQSATGAGSAGADAAYARAKDKIGEQGRASLNSLRDAAAETGAFVAGGENPSLRAAEASIINKAQGGLGDVVRQQAIDEAARAAERETMERAAQLGLQATSYEAQLAANRQASQQQADQQARYMDSVLSALAGTARLY